MRKTSVLLAAGALALSIAASVLVARAAGHNVTAPVAPGVQRAARRASVVSNIATRRVTPGVRRPLRGPVVPPAARLLATRYAVDAFSTVSGISTNEWVRIVAPMCAAPWRTHLARGTNGASVATKTLVPRVVRTFASWAPSGMVGVTVVLQATGSALESIYLGLREVHGRYVVEATQ